MDVNEMSRILSFDVRQPKGSEVNKIITHILDDHADDHADIMMQCGESDF